MESHFTVELPQAFVVGEAELKKLTDLLSDRIGPFEIRAECVDDVTRTFKTVKEISGYENSKGKELRRLHVSARSEDFKKRATIDLYGSQWRGISLDFDARDDVVSRLRADVLEIVGGMRPWYSAFHRVDFVSILVVTYLVLWIGLLIFVAVKQFPSEAPKEASPSSSALAQLIIYGAIAGVFVVGIVLNRFRDTIFPRAVFLIGQGKSRFQHLERIQWGIVIAFIVSFVAGAIIAVWQAVAT